MRILLVSQMWPGPADPDYGVFVAQIVRELERRGQPVKLLGPWDDNTGHASAIRIDHVRGFLEGGADPRGDGAASGY